ncbi:hypothetical protein AB5Q63_004679 [Vibrio parahaemolyticus]|uniref:hypothetical protein n=1 Tax=Vibrio parahaemolyticus TaxID=670 RepID=UPI001F2C9121|nr:hypothetical protein [Vibrio parahaemolyticus]EGV1833452.1 hypothetical protein [Vibrio parahaemolyticus]EHW0650982.1 hypothetical protein [Vibrio parahaemolyticus]MCG0031078.1 hypothetical protein [Vibrio parahaemolyticus]
MDKIISTAFEEMCGTYERMLCSFYPARDSTGFTEQNQVHNFVNALKTALDDADSVHWLEFPWVSKSEHIDGMVFSPKYKSIFYIEAKRLSKSIQKSLVVDDIERVISNDRSFINSNELYAENEYIIALSDVWLEDKWKTAIPHWWLGSEDLPVQFQSWEHKHKRKLATPKSTLQKELQKRNIDWANSKSLVYLVGDKVNKVKNYCLLLASKKI